MVPSVDEESIQAEFNLKQIDAPMPEAPWAAASNMRCDHSEVKFNTKAQQATTPKFFLGQPQTVPDDNTHSRASVQYFLQAEFDKCVSKESDAPTFQLPVVNIQKPCQRPECQQMSSECAASRRSNNGLSETNHSLNEPQKVSDSLVRLHPNPRQAKAEPQLVSRPPAGGKQSARYRDISDKADSEVDASLDWKEP